MRNEERQLLLQDLCARLPYGVQCKYNRILPIGWKVSNPSTDGTLQSIEIETSGIINVKIDGRLHGLSDFKPYLRPMESMTTEERLELSKLSNDKFKFYLYAKDPEIICFEKYNYLEGLKVLDLLNSHYLDYRGLIPMGLALPASEDMYK